jgi:hypothetical protein
MFYHIKISYESLNEQGESVNKNEEYLVKDCELHAEAEQRGYEYASEYQFNDPDIVSVKRSNIREFVNEVANEDETIIYDAIIADIYINENTGKEKETKYHVGVFAKSVSDATKKVYEYMNQGLNDMRFIGVKETKIVEII